MDGLQCSLRQILKNAFCFCFMFCSFGVPGSSCWSDALPVPQINAFHLKQKLQNVFSFCFSLNLAPSIPSTRRRWSSWASRSPSTLTCTATVTSASPFSPTTGAPPSRSRPSVSPSFPCWHPLKKRYCSVITDNVISRIITFKQFLQVTSAKTGLLILRNWVYVIICFSVSDMVWPKVIP